MHYLLSGRLLWSQTVRNDIYSRSLSKHIRMGDYSSLEVNQTSIESQYVSYRFTNTMKSYKTCVTGENGWIINGCILWPWLTLTTDASIPSSIKLSTNTTRFTRRMQDFLSSIGETEGPQIVNDVWNTKEKAQSLQIVATANFNRRHKASTTDRPCSNRSLTTIFSCTRDKYSSTWPYLEDCGIS